MAVITFDVLGYFEKLKAAGVPEAQAKLQLEAMQDAIKNYDEASRKDLATKGDLELEMQKMRVEMQAMKNELIKWMMSGFIALGAIIFAALAFLR